ncbi:unnamed protein product [Thlaspi arvense]|uniref:Uncharacterized protein n=1 Tax=Thlaspi arvense TaxID=13288 RepID=A0AAU9T7I5_THLAR|nr:unnamed protein product [Thlaspi arvense]
MKQSGIAFVMNLLLLLFAAFLIRSDQSMLPLKSFKQIRTVPVLKHTKELITNAQLFTEKHFNLLTIDSPRTHVSIHRDSPNTLDLIMFCILYNSSINIAGLRLSREGPFRGIESRFNAYNLNIGKDQSSYSQIYVDSGLNNQYCKPFQQINPSIFGDGHVWSYGFWKDVIIQHVYDLFKYRVKFLSSNLEILNQENLRGYMALSIRYFPN